MRKSRKDISIQLCSANEGAWGTCDAIWLVLKDDQITLIASKFEESEFEFKISPNEARDIASQFLKVADEVEGKV